MTRLPSMCLLLALSFSTSLGAPLTNTVEVSIGEPHDYPVPASANITGPIDLPLPSWIVKDGGVLKMIAPPDADKSNIVVIGGTLTLEVIVKGNEPTGCASDEWAEAVVDGPPIKHWNAVMELAKNVDDIEMTNIRIVPRHYAQMYRELTEKDAESDSFKGDTVIIVKSKCGKAVAPVLEEMYGAGFEQVSITHGSIPSRSARNEDVNSILSSSSSTDEPIGEELEMKKETTTLASTTTTRQTRSTSVAYVPIKGIECKQGSFCVGELEDKTFFSKDGGVGTFELTIESIDGMGGVKPWVIKEGKKRSIGVIPLKAGEHTFRLKGIDTKKKPVYSPFSISVKSDEPKNHQFKMTMHSLPPEPEHLRTTVIRLASFLKRNADEIKVANISRDDPLFPVVTYWNTSLPTTSCPTQEVGQWLRSLHKHGEEVSSEFAKAFTHHPTIHPYRLEVQWIGKCESAGVEEKEREVKTAGGGGASSGKGEEEPIAEQTEASLSTLITIVCLLALLLALLILAVCCFACKRSKATKGGVNEYMSKGTPVVFPDEVEDENADIPATAPMLVKEERPPLRVSEHSNPLYKPPPPLASTAASPRPSAAPSGQKLPPPYVPP